MSSPLQSPKIVLKPWGREIWYAEQAAYAGKVLEISAGKRLSLQYHERKTETLYLLSGRVIVTVTAEHEYTWEAGQALHIPVHTIHRFAAVTDAVLLEVSTPDLTDVVRLQDDFARPARD